MKTKLTGALRRATGIAMAISLLGIGLAQANPFGMGADALHAVHVHDFDDDHAHLAEENALDRIHPLVLAALPKGKAYVKYNAPSNCVPGRLKAVLSQVSAKYGPITVNSTVRSRSKNRSVGGRNKSYHLSCAAVDFRVHGSTKGLMSYLASNKSVGGLKRYSSGFYHIDTGPRRSW